MTLYSSSVTAGHDSLFNESFPSIIETQLKPVFAASNIELIVRNVALGNNPCVPYDICVRTFAGLDADIIHWEQTYNCPGNCHVMEEFVRQALLIPSKPIIVFSQSETATWNQAVCVNFTDHYKARTDKENELLKAQPSHLVSDLNKDEFRKSVRSNALLR